MKLIHEFLVLNLFVEVSLCDDCLIFGGLIEFGLDLRVNSELNHGDLHVLACLGQMSLQDVHAFDDAVKTSLGSLRLVSTRVRDLSLVLVIGEERHEGVVEVSRGKLKNI